MRPSTDRTREALFSILASRVEGAVVLDLFAGTGALGLEALSRGAERALFVEGDRRVARVTEDNVKVCGLEGRVVVAEVLRFLSREKGSYDLIFADPPYKLDASHEDYPAKLLSGEALRGILADDGLLVMEVWKQAAIPRHEGWTLVDDRSYGISRILFFEKDRKAG